LLARQSANINPAEDAVSVADNDVIGSVAEEFGQESQEDCDGAPPTWELFQDEEDGVRAGE
jgi:hypothetical protein